MTREARKLSMGLDEGLDVRVLKRKTTRSWVLKVNREGHSSAR